MYPDRTAVQRDGRKDASGRADPEAGRTGRADGEKQTTENRKQVNDMNYGGDAADQIVRYSLDGVDHGLRL